ncbi:MAG: bifunctional homocysteine S-methyltransferase/methylenetetrahydrofolate reductase, partial [Bacteroidota bacterium]
AGAEVIETNTFSANRYRLGPHQLDDKVEEINLRGAEIARRSAGDDCFVAGAVGPTGKLLEPVGKLRRQDVRNAFKEQIEALLKGGVDLIILETFVSLQELDEAIAAATELTDLPIVAQKAFAEDGSILAGNFPIEVVEHIIQKGVDVIGANCTVGPQRMFSIIRSMYKDGVYLSAQPAAGIPTLKDGRSIYHATPEYLAAYARELVEAGVTLIGACCGSTPSHIRAIGDAIHGIRVGKVEAKPRSAAPVVVKDRDAQVWDSGVRSNFARNLGKKFLKTVELDIPRGLEINSVLEGAAALKTLGIDAIDITDGARARLRMSSITLSYLLQRDVGIEAMTHLATRDRNMIGLQAELLGAHALGLRNILCITGDPTSIGDYPHANSVFDVDAIGLIRAVKSMNEGTDLMGNPIGRKTSFLIACAANPVAIDIDTELDRTRKKVEAGAQVLFTQPVYEMKTLEWFLDQIKDLQVPVMLGILPLRSHKHAEFLHHEVPGIRIPDTVREGMKRAGDKASRLGVELAVNLLSEARPFVQGVYMMPPFKKYSIVADILSALN